MKNFNWELILGAFVASLAALVVYSLVTTQRLNPDNSISTEIAGMGSSSNSDDDES